MLSGMSGRRHARVVLAAVTAALLGAALTSGQATAAAPQTSTGSEAVIIVMRSQHQDLKPKLQVQQRIKAVDADQAGVVSDLRSHGASHIEQLSTVSAVAAHTTAAEISRLQADPSVAYVVPDRVIPKPAVGVQSHGIQQPGGRAACTSDPS